MRFFILAVILLFSSGFAFGQDAAEARYRLHRPTAADYLTLIAEYADSVPNPWHRPLEAEIGVEYPELSDQDYALIERAYQALLPREYYGASTALNHSYWIPNLVRAWLRAHPTDLSGTAELTIGDGIIDVLPVDFDGDRRDEYALHYISPIVEGFVFLKADEADAGYAVIPSPLRFELRPSEDPTPYDGDDTIPVYFSHMATGDFTQDGSADLVLLYDQFTDSIMYEYSEQRLYILSWADDAIVDVGDASLSLDYQYQSVGWDIVTPDPEAGMVIQQTREMSDNWRCDYTRTTTYSWNGTAITETDHHDTFPESAPCYLRFAEGAMWEYKYDEAIDLYNQYRDALGEGYGGEYPRLRYALALILSDQIDEGMRTLTGFEGISTWTFAPLVDQMHALYESNPTPLRLCFEVYNYFAWNPLAAWNNETIEVGATVDNMIYERGMHSPFVPSPARAGCDFPQHLTDLLDKTSFVTAAPPLEQLRKFGLFSEISFHHDLNADGIDDWLVWMPTIRVAPILFLSNFDLYQVSRPEISEGFPINAQNTLTTIRLPNEAGLALLNVDFSEHFTVYSPGMGVGAEVGVCEASGRVTVWRLTGSELTAVLSERLCEEVSPSQVVDNLNLVQKVYAWRFADMVENYYTPVTFEWDSASQTFVIPPTFQMTLTPQPTVTPQPGSEALPANPNRLRRTDPADLYKAGEYAQIIALRDEAITSPDIDAERVLAWHYMTARAHEALGHDDEALAEYVAIHETKITTEARTAWVLLAGLHIERIVD